MTIDKQTAEGAASWVAPAARAGAIRHVWVRGSDPARLGKGAVVGKGHRVAHLGASRRISESRPVIDRQGVRGRVSPVVWDALSNVSEADAAPVHAQRSPCGRL